ncbi:MAG: DUF255 domain-containing protein [Akkermansiaceae bacterium]|nr:DUF255 domain-containing protein [Akkermansiaceae bacterium]
MYNSMFRQCAMIMLGATAAMVAPAAQIEWMSDLDSACQKAREEGKLLLVEFTGSDWCKACILQKKNVLDKPEFAAWVHQHYVPVEVNVPNNPAVVGGEAALKKNKAICDEFDIKIFPSLMIMSPDMVILGGYHGAESSPAAAMAALKKSQPSVAEYEAAMKLQGAERAVALYAFYQKQPQEYRAVAYPLIRLIALADEENVTGIHEVYKPLHQKKSFDAELSAAKNFEDKLSVVNMYISVAEPENKPGFVRRKELLLRARVFEIMKNPSSVEDVILARQLFLQAAECMPDPNARAQMIKDVNAYYADPEALFLQIKNKKK